MEIPKSLENDSFLFCNEKGELSYIKMRELSEDQLEEFISRFSEYADKCISERERGSRYGK